MAAAVRRSTVQFTAQTARRQWMLFITTSMDDHDAEKRTEQNSILGSGKSKAKITDNIRMRSRNCTTEATDSDRHEV